MQIFNIFFEDWEEENITYTCSLEPNYENIKLNILSSAMESPVFYI